MPPQTLTEFMISRLYASLMMLWGIAALFQSSALAQRSFLVDGVYLYGQSSQADEVGKEYLVFQMKAGKIQGAIYYPFSEFNCFSGSIVANQMKLGIIDPNDRQVYPYNIALVSPSALAMGEISAGLNLGGYHRLAHLSENDQRILKVCLKSGEG